MKKIISKNKVCLASLMLVAVLSSETGFSQDKKEIKRTIIIENGDTTINGKKLADVSKAEQARLRKEMKDMGKTYTFKSDMPGSITIEKDSAGDGRTITIKRFDRQRYVPGEGGDMHLRIEGMPGRPHGFMFRKGDSSVIAMNLDSTMKQFNFRIEGLDSNIRNKMLKRLPDMRMEMPNMFGDKHFDFPQGFNMRERENSQSFSFRNTDKDGITTRVNLRISDAGKDAVKKISNAEKADLEIQDLNLFPNFSTGKMTLAFNLASKSSAKVQVLDTDMKTIFTDNVSGSGYNKQIDLPKNGVYYLAVSQGGKWAVKKIIKE